MPHSVLFMAQNHPSGKPLHDYCLKTFFLSDQGFLGNFFIVWGHKVDSERGDAGWCSVWKLQSREITGCEHRQLFYEHMKGICTSEIREVMETFRFLLCFYLYKATKIFQCIFYSLFFPFLSGKSTKLLCYSTFHFKFK